MAVDHKHQSHRAIIKRLKRAAGHLATVIEMIEHGRPCLDISQQLHAVEKAVSEAKRTLIRDHLDHCLEEAVGPMSREQRRPIDEFKDIAKYL
jgi:DNA-binding FrmR family transcriptional regulator